MANYILGILTGIALADLYIGLRALWKTGKKPVIRWCEREDGEDGEE